MGHLADWRLLPCVSKRNSGRFLRFLVILIALYLVVSLASLLKVSSTPKHTGEDFQKVGSVVERRIDGNPANGTAGRKQPRKRLAPGACSCGEDLLELWDSLENSAMIRRRKELEEWKRLHEHEREPLVECQASSPLRYPASGITIEPFETIRVKGLMVDPNHAIVKRSKKHTVSIVSEKSLGILFVSNTTEFGKADVSGNYTQSVRIQAETATVIHNILQTLHYKSIYFDIDTRDKITVTLNNSSYTINVRIKRWSMPFLYDPGESHHVNDLVTVITKTFERYDAVNRLIKSVNKHYPGMTIVVADDSQRPQRLSGKHVKHYTMPFAEGASAGRNLALSQVRTKYFLYVDDDYVFTRGTKLENFFGKFEDFNSKLDVIGGTFGDDDGNLAYGPDCHGCNRFQFTHGNDEGDCLIRFRDYWYRSLTSFPQCHYTDMTTMFFMARTTAVRQAGGFDPEYERLGHTEYFFDWMGKLTVASCHDVNIFHQRVDNDKYIRYRSREVDPNDQINNVKHSLFKNNLNCFVLG